MDSAVGTKRVAKQPAASGADGPAVGVGASAEGAAPAPAQPAKKKRVLSPEQELADAFRRGVIDAVRVGDARAALALYADMAAKNVTRTAHICNTILSLCARVLPGGDAELVAHARRVFAAMPAAGVARSEAAYTSVIRLCAVSGDAAAGRAYLDEMLADGASAPRLRTYAPLLGALAARGDADGTEELFRAMTGRGIVPTQAEWACLLAALARGGRAAPALAAIDEMADVVYELEPTLLAVVEAALGGQPPPRPLPPPPSSPPAAAAATAATAPPDDDGGSGAVVASLLRAAAAPVPPLPGWRAARTHVDPATGRCGRTGARLRSVDVTDAERAALSAQVEALAGGARNRGFAALKEWLAARAGAAAGAADAPGRPRAFGAPPPPVPAPGDCGFDVVIDGPNVGFCNQNFRGGALMYTQIDAVARHWAARGAGVAIFMGASWLDSARITATERRRPVKRPSGASGGGGRGTGGWASRPHEAAAATAADGAAAASAADDDALWDGGDDDDSEGGGGDAAADDDGDGPAARGDDAFDFGDTDDAASEGEDEEDEEEDPDCIAPSSLLQAPPPPRPPRPPPVVVARHADADTAVAAAVVARWAADGLVYRVPPGNNDDWYWLYAAVAAGGVGGGGAPAGADGERAPPPRRPVFLVSNDFMRDHHFDMLAPRALLKWRERHQVAFNFAWDRRVGGVRPTFRFPRVYSHRMQRDAGADTWHFPIAGTRDEWVVAWRDAVAEPAAAAGGGI